MKTKITIKIPRELYRKLGEIMRGTSFSSVSEFIAFAMRTVASSGEVAGGNRLTVEGVRAIRERLRRPDHLKEKE